MKKALLLIFFLWTFTGWKKTPKTVTKITAKTVEIDASLEEKEAYTALIAPYKSKMISEINTVISYAPKDINRQDGKLQSSLGNLLADLCVKRANAIFNKKTNQNIDFSMFNYDGIRAGISKGVVTNKNPFELMPFENSLVVVELSGKKIADLIDYFIRNNKAHPLSKNIELKIFQNDTYELRINSQKFDITKKYFVLTSDYLQSGGDGMNFFKNPISIFKTGYKMRHAIVDEFKSQDTLRTALDKRIQLN